MAAALRRDLHIDVQSVAGHYGEFTVLVDDEVLVSAGAMGFLGVLPSVRTVRNLVERRLRVPAPDKGGS